MNNSELLQPCYINFQKKIRKKIILKPITFKLYKESGAQKSQNDKCAHHLVKVFLAISRAPYSVRGL
jgi:hypothetical protein